MGFLDIIFPIKPIRKIARGILEGPEIPEPEPLPIPDPPIVSGTGGEAVASQQRKFIKAGRRGTLITGQLSPSNIGKKRLLG